MARVDVCPVNLTTITEASTRLGCGKDEYGNDQYICLPTVDMSSLVEFCYNGIMGYHEKGNCLQASKGNLTLSPCVGFSSGCPKTGFKSSDFYKYSACQNLDLENRCYKMDPTCPQNIDEKMSDTLQAGFIVVIAAIPIGVLFVFCVMTYLFLRKRRKQRKTKTIAEDQKETNNENGQEMHNLSSDENPDSRPLLNKGIESYSKIEGDGALLKSVKTKKKKRGSIELLTDGTLKEMQKLFAGEEALSIVESAILGIKRSIETDTKSDDVSNILYLLRLLTMITSNSKTPEFELKSTRCFLLKVFHRYSLQSIDKLSEQCRMYCDLSNDWTSANKFEEILIRLNACLTDVKSAPKCKIDHILDKFSIKDVSNFLIDLKSKASKLILESEVTSAQQATGYINLYFKIAMLHSFVLWQVYCIQSSSSSYDKLSTKDVYYRIKSRHTSNLEVLKYITHPSVEHAVFSSVCHITDNENVRNFLQIYDIKPFHFGESFYTRKHCIQWVKSPNVNLEMTSSFLPYRTYNVRGTTFITEGCQFNFVFINGRKVDNICYIRSAHWEDYYMRMSENGSCDAVKTIPEHGGKWKFAPFAINQEHQMFIISSVDWPGKFLYLEPDGRSVKGESDLKKIKENGLWEICDVEREQEALGVNSAKV